MFEGVVVVVGVVEVEVVGVEVVEVADVEVVGGVLEEVPPLGIAKKYTATPATMITTIMMTAVTACDMACDLLPLELVTFKALP